MADLLSNITDPTRRAIAQVLLDNQRMLSRSPGDPNEGIGTFNRSMLGRRPRATTALASAIMNVQPLEGPTALDYIDHRRPKFGTKTKHKVDWSKEGF